MSVRRIGILGGTFDPIHRGHIDVGRAATEALGLTRLFVIPAHLPPHREQPVASPFHRFAMVALTVAGEAVWRASDLELRAQGPSYTSTTLRHFHERGFSASELFFVIGADAFADIGIWKDYPRILDLAHFVVVSRPGHPIQHLPRRWPHLSSRMVHGSDGTGPQGDPRIFLIDAVTGDVSSTAIRRRLAEGLSIADMVAPSVEQHIERHGLYTSGLPERRGID